MGLIGFLLSSTETEASKSIKRTRAFVFGSQAYHKEIGRNRGDIYTSHVSWFSAVSDIVPKEPKIVLHIVFQCYHRAEL